MISIVTDDNNDELWGQFTDIEHGYSFQEQKVVYFSKPKPKSSPKPIQEPIQIPLPKTTPILIPVVNLCTSKMEDKCNSYHEHYVINGKPWTYRTNTSYKNIKINDDDFYNPAFDKIIERQIYLGCIICLLTVGLFILP